MSNSITQDMRYRQSLNSVPQNMALAVQVESTTRAGRTSTTGKHAGTGVWNLWPAIIVGIIIFGVIKNNINIHLAAYYSYS